MLCIIVSALCALSLVICLFALVIDLIIHMSRGIIPDSSPGEYRSWLDSFLPPGFEFIEDDDDAGAIRRKLAFVGRLPPSDEETARIGALLSLPVGFTIRDLHTREAQLEAELKACVNTRQAEFRWPTYESDDGDGDDEEEVRAEFDALETPQQLQIRELLNLADGYEGKIKIWRPLRGPRPLR